MTPEVQVRADSRHARSLILLLTCFGLAGCLEIPDAGSRIPVSNLLREHDLLFQD